MSINSITRAKTIALKLEPNNKRFFIRLSTKARSPQSLKTGLALGLFTRLTMTVSNISRAQTIIFRVPDSNSQIQTIYQNDPSLIVGRELKPGYAIISVNNFIKNLKAFAKLESLEEAPLPDFKLEDSATAKLTKTLDVEWKSPRKQLNLFITNAKNPTESQWYQVGSISLLNPYGYPFRIYNLMDLFTDNLALELGENGKIGVQVENVGYGLLSPSDTVTVHGSCMEEIFIESAELPNVININLTGLAASANQLSNLADNSSLIDNSFLVSN